ncbi:MAG: hypothetical protein IT282_02495 [Bacteroidetes bacterium]|nr:hypothetical protein [Bacteroidota bacterium]
MKRILLLVVAGLCAAQIVDACTSAVVSGRATRDGRPLLWKQRDTGNLQNKMVYSKGGTYAFVGVHDLADSANQECFMGSNEAGFSIINTASYNLQYEKYRGKMDEEGILMRQALGTCRTLEDFERLLLDTKGKRGVETNFGVVDAQGGAAYYETDPYAFVKYDANDPAVAPQGYIIRTNFSMSGTPENGQGYIRYQSTQNLFQWAFLGEGISVDFILLEGTTNLRHGLVGTDLTKGELPFDEDSRTMVNFTDFVPRYSTATSMIVQGVRKGEDPSATTVWTVLGSPLTTPVIPVWVKYADQIPAMMLASGPVPAALNEHALKLKGRCFPLKTPEGRNYLDLSKILNQQGTGTVQRVHAAHQKVLQAARALVLDRGGEVRAREVSTLYSQVQKIVREYYAGYRLWPDENPGGTSSAPR